MTDADIELLRLAARAAGHKFRVIRGQPHIRAAEGWTPWNTLEDSGQALELAVRLKIDILHSDEPGDPWVMAGDINTVEDVTSESSREKATRRAITRAAAATVQGDAA